MQGQYDSHTIVAILNQRLSNSHLQRTQQQKFEVYLANQQKGNLKGY